MRGRWPSSSPDRVEPCGQSGGAAEPRCSRQASPGPPRRRLCWRLLAGPGTLPSSSPALAYRPGRVRGDPALPFPGLPLPTAPGPGKAPGSLPCSHRMYSWHEHPRALRGSREAGGRCRGWGYHMQFPACSCMLRRLWRLHGDECEATAASGSHHPNLQRMQNLAGRGTRPALWGTQHHGELGPGLGQGAAPRGRARIVFHGTLEAGEITSGV